MRNRKYGRVSYRDYRRTPEPRPPLLEAFAHAPVTWAILAINVAVYVVASLQGNPARNSLLLLQFGATERSLIWSDRQYWRFVTAMFMHIGWLHLLWNCYCMYGWCAPVENQIGKFRFVLVYLCSGVGASAVSVLCHDAVSAGASGAAFGIVGVTLLLELKRTGSWEDFFSDPQVRNILVTIALWTGIGLYAVPNMDHYAHLGGLATGALFGWVLTLDTDDDRARSWAGLSFGALLLLVVVAAAHPWFGQTARYGRFARESVTKFRLSPAVLRDLPDEQRADHVVIYVLSRFAQPGVYDFALVDSFPRPIQHVFRVWGLEKQRGDGGLQQYVRMFPGAFVRETVEGLLAFGAPETAKLLEATIAAEHAHDSGKLRELDGIFQKGSEDLKALMARYVREHLDEFVGD